MRLRRVSPLCRWCAALAVVLICSCQPLSGGSSPLSSLPPGFPAGCTANFAVAQVNRLLAALGRGSPDAGPAPIGPPAPHQAGLELTCSLSDFLAGRPATAL